MLNIPAKGTQNYEGPLNENFKTLEDKLQYKALCTYDSAGNVFTLTLENIPAAVKDQLPLGLPDKFTVVTQFPVDYEENAIIRIGETDFTTKYAAFEAGDTIAVSFNLPEKVCFFSAGAVEPPPVPAAVEYPAAFIREPRYIKATGNTGLTITPPCVFTLPSGTVCKINQPVTLSTASLDTGSAFTYGNDYYVYIHDAGALVPDIKFVISLNPNAPGGASVLNSRKIGGFHYGEVRNVNANGEEINSSGAVRGSGWEGNTKTAIVPNSVWTEQHRPICTPEGMVFVTSGFWSDIYLASMDANGKPVSVYNQLPTTGTEGFNWYTWVERAVRAGKRLLSYDEFIALAAGSPQGNDANNTNAWSATTNTARNRTGLVKNAVSNVGVRDAAGNVYKWLAELITRYDTGTGVSAIGAWAWKDAFPGYGKAYMNADTQLSALIAGGYWVNGVNAGPRAVTCNNFPWVVNTYIGAVLGCDAQQSGN